MHLIFDLDGTLINSLPGIANSLNAALAENNLPEHDTETVRGFIGDGSYVLCERAAPSLDSASIDAIDAAFRENYAKLWQDGTVIYDGIIDLLKSIPAGHHLSILSNKPHAFTEEIISSIFPKNMFSTVLGQRQGINKKPDPSGIHEILQQSNHPDKTAYLIGDSTVDLTTANNAKIGSIGVTWGFESSQDLSALNPDHIVDSVAKLKQLINTLSNHD